jgi:hypothetical protein
MANVSALFAAGGPTASSIEMTGVFSLVDAILAHSERSLRVPVFPFCALACQGQQPVEVPVEMALSDAGEHVA